MVAVSKIKIDKIKTLENQINKNLFIICAIVTLTTMVLVTIEFFRGVFSPSKH